MSKSIDELWDIVRDLANDQKRLWVLLLDTRTKMKFDGEDCELAQRLEVKFDHVNARLDQLLLYAEEMKR